MFSHVQFGKTICIKAVTIKELEYKICLHLKICLEKNILIFQGSNIVGLPQVGKHTDRSRHGRG
jgi:hypothetical protein